MRSVREVERARLKNRDYTPFKDGDVPPVPVAGLSEAQINAIMIAVKPVTMAPPSAVRFSIQQAILAVNQDIPGVFVECGVWKGGNSIAMLLAQRQAFGEVKRKVHLLDSFIGLPPADPKMDGPGAVNSQHIGGEGFHWNCKTKREDLEATLARFNFVDGRDFKTWEGWFADTTPKLADEVADERIALLRLDGDWYDSTMTCLNNLIPVTTQNATVILDDYYAWDGCTRAIHNYLSSHDYSWQLKSVCPSGHEDYNNSGCYFNKGFG